MVTASIRRKPTASPAVLSTLGRDDKWYLGGGNRLLWTPAFPQWLDLPGFWDEAHYYHAPLAPLFMVHILDEQGEEVPLQFGTRHWQPNRLRQTYTDGAGFYLTERKTLLPSDVLASDLTLENEHDVHRTLHVVAWVVYPLQGEDRCRLATVPGVREGCLDFALDPPAHGGPTPRVYCQMGMSRPIVSHAVMLSDEAAALPPRWAYTPFHGHFAAGQRLGASVSALPASGCCYLALHTSVMLAPHASERLSVGFAAAPLAQEARHGLKSVFMAPSATEGATTAWQDYFDRLPQLVCSDPFLEQYYRYRWYGLRLLTIQGGEDNYTRPALCEGPGPLRAPSALSTAGLLREARWMDMPDIAQGGFLNFVHTQRLGGRYLGTLDAYALRAETFCQAPWSHVWDIHLVHPDGTFLAEAYRSLEAYVRYCDAERDPEGSGLYDLRRQHEGGLPFMRRYQAVCPEADQGEGFRLKGVDVSVYLYQIKQALSKMATALGRDDEALAWDVLATQTGRAILDQMWDPEAELFFDLDPQTDTGTGVKAATCFFPYTTDLVEAEHLPGLKRHLFDPKSFWTPYPVPSSSQDDPTFSAEAQWQGRRVGCPANGRVWPFLNSHIAEALAATAMRLHDEDLRQHAADFIHSTIRLLFFDQDPRRPNSFEHYNPLNGKPSRYRGLDDHLQAWVLDLIIKYVCGVRPGTDAILIDPFPFDIETFSLDNLYLRGHRLGVERQGQWFSVWVDGDHAGEWHVGTQVELTL